MERMLARARTPRPDVVECPFLGRASQGKAPLHLQQFANRNDARDAAILESYLIGLNP